MRHGWLALLLILPPALAQDTKEPDKKEPPKFGIKEDRPDTSEEDQKLLGEFGQKTDGPSLLDYFRKRTYKEADPKAISVYIRDLADEDFDVRETAYAKLMGLGASALVAIKEAEKHADTEVKRRAEELRIRIEASAQPGAQAAVARLIGKAKPAGAAEVLLNYVPYAADHNVINEICIALGDVALRDGKVDAPILKALEDEHPLKRAAAGEALMRAGVKAELPSVRKLLKDKDAQVRLRAGLSLARVYEKDALPVLVDLLEELAPEQLWPAEEILVRLAGEKAPQVSLGTTDVTRKKARDAWSEWVSKNMDTIDLAKIDLETAQLGYTLIVMQNFGGIVGGRRVPNQGEVLELDGAKKLRWKFAVPTYPVDAQVVGPDKVLVCEFHGAKISERDIKGNVIWEKAVGGNPIGLEKLSTGNIFVAMQNRLIEMDRTGKELWAIDRPGHDIFRAKKLRSGEVAFVTNTGMYVRMDPKTKAVAKQFPVGQIPVLFGSFDVLGNGHVVVPDFNRHRVVEFDAEGKEVKSFNVMQFPNSVQRLPNGNTLVSSQNTRKLSEYDRAGTEVWSHSITDGQPFNVRRR
jgi:hypothetical protein